MLANAYSVKIGVILSVQFKRRKVDKKKQTYMKTETCKLYSRDFWIFLPNIINIDLYNSELYRFKVGAFFWDSVQFQFTYFTFLVILSRGQSQPCPPLNTSCCKTKANCNDEHSDSRQQCNNY